jgi:hypothetical protein
MTKKINELSGDQLKKVKPPTLTEQVKNLQERVHEIEQREGSQDDEAVAKMITEALDRYCVDKGVVFWGDKRNWPEADRARSAVRATFAEEAGSAPTRSAPILTAGILGAALSFIAIAISAHHINQEFAHLQYQIDHIPITVMGNAFPAQRLDKTTPATTDEEKQSAIPDLPAITILPVGTSRAGVVAGTRSCWMRVTVDGKIVAEGFLSSLHPADTAGRAQWIEWKDVPSAEIRSGCPGKVEYFVDGNQRYPENHSGTPEKSEVVTLP